MTHGTRFKDMKNIVDLITQVSTPLIPADKGVDLYFINNEGEYRDLREEGVHEAMNKARSGITESHLTEIGYNLKRRILKPLVYDVLDGGGELAQPILVSILTDGEPNGRKEKESDRSFVEAISKCGGFLTENGRYPRTGMSLLLLVA